MLITNCKTNHLSNPLGYEMKKPVFSYMIEQARGTKQVAGRIQISLSADMQTVVFDSGWDQNMDSIAYRADFLPSPRTRYYWNVSVRTNASDEETSEVHWFETSKQDEPWQAKWISCDSLQSRHPVFRKDIRVTKSVRCARLYICGLGLYRAFWNDKAIGDEWLAPYCNNYHQWLQYQTYDLTDQISTDGTLSVLLGNGWYKGRFGYTSKPEDPGYYGQDWRMIAELHIVYADGTSQIIGTDESWTIERSHITASSIYDGEHADETLPALPSEQARIVNETTPLVARYSVPVKIKAQRKPVAVIQTPAGETVLDIGQNHSGIFKLKVHEPKGTRIYLQFGEILQNGCFYRDNFRTATADYSWISDGQPHELIPNFTFYGYRYVKIEGIQNLDPQDYTAYVLYSDLPATGRIETGNPLVNQLISNVEWGLRSNFVDVPTDCPQRDERMGWTGDAQVFSPTACFLHDSYAFYRKYLHDIYMEQLQRKGMVPDVIPAFAINSCACVWGDAACIIPWNLYQFYGDISILDEQYDSMKSWVDYIQQLDGDDHHWRKVFHYGDWLALDHPSGKVDTVMGGTDTGFIADVYYRLSAGIVAEAARLLNKEEDAKKYQALQERLSREIQEEYYSATGRCCIDTQTAAILTLRDGLCPDPERAGQQLVQLLRDHENKLKTGFVGTPFLCQILSGIGQSKLAYDLLLNEEYPGWLYAVKLGATTVWERWNSVMPDGSISSTGMNSLNHYAYGSILEWLWRHGAGLNPTHSRPGFREVEICPELDLRIKQMDASYLSPCGTFEIHWKIVNNYRVYLRLSVPFGATAKLRLPKAAPVDRIGLGPCVEGNYRLDAGEYEITYDTEEPIRKAHSSEDPIRTLLQDMESAQVLNGILGKFEPPPQCLDMTIRQLFDTFHIDYADDLFQRIDEALLCLTGLS